MFFRFSRLVWWVGSVWEPSSMNWSTKIMTLKIMIPTTSIWVRSHGSDRIGSYILTPQNQLCPRSTKFKIFDDLQIRKFRIMNPSLSKKLYLKMFHSNFKIGFWPWVSLSVFWELVIRGRQGGLLLMLFMLDQYE